MISFFYLFLAGIAGGFVAGLVGIGGGVVYIFIIPIALKFLSVPVEEIPQYTIANSIFAIFFASTAANYVNIRNKNFFSREVSIIGILGVASSILTLEYIVHTPWYSMTIFDIILIILLLFMLYNTLIAAKKVYVTPPNSLKKWKLTTVGSAGGIISALSGLGGGIIVIPILNSLMRVDIKKASSISLGVITMMSFFMTIFNLLETPDSSHNVSYSTGYIIFPVSLSLTAGVLLGSPVGVKVARKLAPHWISYSYAFFLLMVILKKIVELVKLT